MKCSFLIYIFVICSPLITTDTTSVYGAEKVVRISTVLRQDKSREKESLPPGKNAERLKGSAAWNKIRTAFHDAGYTIIFKPYPWKRALVMAQNDQTDIIFPISRSEERDKHFLFSKRAVTSTDYVIYVKENSTIEWKGIASCNGLRIGVISGWNYSENFQNNKLIEKYSINSLKSAFLMLEAGRLDGLAGYESNFDNFIRKNNLHGTVKKLSAFGSKREYIAGSKNNPRTEEYLKIFDAANKTDH